MDFAICHFLISNIIKPMLFTVLDLILLIIIFLFVAFGFTLGFIHSLGSLIGALVGAWVAGTFYQYLADLILPFFLGNQIAAEIFSFLFIFILVNRLFGLIVWFFNRIFNFISIIPFTKTLNRLLGAAFGFVEGVFVVGLTINFMLGLDFSPWLSAAVSESLFAKLLLLLVAFLMPILPEIFKRVKEII